MDFSEAIRRANQILDEEARNQTARYTLVGWAEHPTEPFTEQQYIDFLWEHQPERVFDDQGKFKFDSDNYKMLTVLHGKLAPDDRASFPAALLGRMHAAPACRWRRNLPVGQPFGWGDLVSDLPLLAEFCVRNGAKSAFLRTLAEATPLPGHAVLFEHLKDMVRFAPTIFSEDDYKQICLSVSILARAVQRVQLGAWEVSSKRHRWRIPPEQATRKFNGLSETIEEACRKVSFLHLKHSLLSVVNMEINEDKKSVESYLQALGFSQALRDSLNEAERLYRNQSNAFSLKSSMGHLRSFLESLHKEKMPRIHAKYGGVLPSGWGEGLAYLRKNCVISQPEEKFVAGLYGLISDEAVHPLMAEREYARLARNMVIEYGLLFLRNIEKLGLVANE